MTTNAALTLAILSIASVGFCQEKPMNQVVTEGNRTYIRGIPMLVWGQSGETTFCGAFTIALKQIGIERSYTELMGDSSLAFRVRWWKPVEGVGSCPASPVGEFHPWCDRAAQSAGVKVAYKVDLDQKTDLSEYSKSIKTEIDAGRPVLAYITSYDMGLIYGYMEEGKTVLARDYFVKDEKAFHPLKNTKGLLGFISKAESTPSPKERAQEAIKNAIADWTMSATPFENKGKAGHFLNGDAAYAQWIDDLKSADHFNEEDRNAMFHPSWWTFDVLADARIQAITYLKQIEPLFEAEARSAIAEATAHYSKSVQVLTTSFRDKNVFIGPWTGKKLEDWSGEVRSREAKLLEEARAADNAAIEALKKSAAKF